jgi:acetyltransferase-like isoleucine patch superfamily enzyme
MLKRLIGLVWRKLSKYFASVFLKSYGINVGSSSGIVMYGFPIIELEPGSNILIANNVVLCSHSKFTALGVSKPIILRTLSSHAQIKIGKDVGLSGTTICAAESVTIGRECLFGADVMIFDNDFHPIESEGRRYSKKRVASSPIHIGANVFVGTRSIIMKGVNIGENSIIGAGSNVVSNIPANVIAAGNPCRVIRSIDN